MKTDKNPLLLKTNMGAGHGGSSGRYDALRETAFTYAFMLWQMGVPLTAATDGRRSDASRDQIAKPRRSRQVGASRRRCDVSRAERS